MTNFGRRFEKIETQSVVSVTLSNGLTVIGKLVSKNTDDNIVSITLTKVKQVMVQPRQVNPNEPPVMGIDINMPYCLLDFDADVIIQITDIQAVPLVSNDMEKAYLQLTSGIALAR